MKFTAAVLGDVKGGIKGSFEVAQQQFLCRQGISMCAGWFSDINKDFDKIIKILAQEAATGIGGMSMCPLVNVNRKGRAFPIMLHQFRRALGVTIVRGNKNRKLGRLYYVRGTAKEAAPTYKTK